MEYEKAARDRPREPERPKAAKDRLRGAIEHTVAPLRLQTKTIEIEKGRKVDNSIDIKDTNAPDPSGSQTKISVNEIFDEKFKELDDSSDKSCSIFKVNIWLRESNPDAYTPKMISIGPYHYKNPQLRMEKYKLLYLRRFLQRQRGLDVKSCINELGKLKEHALKCYEDIKDLDTDEFCQMLLLDGCFVVEFIRERCGMSPIGEDQIININNIGYIFLDLMLLENQLPFFVLDMLHHMTKRYNELPLAILVSENSRPLLFDWPKMAPEFFRKTEFCNSGNIKHLLHLVHIFSCHGQNHIKKSKDDIAWHMVMPNATELSKAGVSFEKVSVTTGLFDSIKFENGLMTISCFQVDDGTETLLQNLIAYEQQSVDVQPKYFSDFAIFMNHLIKSEKDVRLFQQKGIMVNWLREDKEVANLFNKIRNGVTTCDNFYFKEQFRKAVEHYEKPLNKIKANLMHNYFSGPWVAASTLVAVILLISQLYRLF